MALTEFWTQVEAWREALGLSVDEFCATYLAITRQQYWALRQGKFEPSSSVVRRILQERPELLPLWLASDGADGVDDTDDEADGAQRAADAA